MAYQERLCGMGISIDVEWTMRCGECHLLCSCILVLSVHTSRRASTGAILTSEYLRGLARTIDVTLNQVLDVDLVYYSDRETKQID
jgi:hypothetical protein